MLGGNSMKRNSVAKLVVLVIMALVSLTNLFGISAAGVSVILGIAAFFVFKKVEKQTFKECGLDFKSIGKEAKRPAIWPWILMPSVMNFLVIILAKLFLPNYIDHVVSRSATMLNVDTLLILIIQLLVFALGEEIAWRAFFQKHLQSFLPLTPALLISSVLFSLGHLTSGSLIIVTYDVLFIFINSLFYGIIFTKTNNAWMSAISHFTANFFAVIILFFL
jgi:membrane protease YdiL (CAAX protease family)